MSTEAVDCPVCIKNESERANWGDGPWSDEPNRVEFEHAGLPCILHRGGMGAWCGYVGLSPGHPAHGKDYDDDALNEIGVHGGLTYADKCQGHVCHVPKPGEPDDLWWLGFDCNHGGDIAPESAALNRRYGFSIAPPWGGSYKTVEYARSETRRLAEQLAQMAEGGTPHVH